MLSSADPGGELSLFFLQYVANKLLCVQLLLGQDQYLEGDQLRVNQGAQ